MSNYQSSCVNDTQPKSLGHTAVESFGEVNFNSPIKLVKLWNQRSRQRSQLAALSVEQLDDIGISREQVEIEAAKPFWVG